MSLDVSDERFVELIGQALDELPQEYVQRMLQDVAVVWENDPSEEQRKELKLHGNQTLFGLYQGVPRTQRDFAGFGPPQVPDKITIFKNPILSYCNTEAELRNQVKKTVWHEMAHYFGLDHKRIYELE